MTELVCPKCESELYHVGNINGIHKYQCNCSVSSNGDLTCIYEEDDNDNVVALTLFMDLSVGYLGYNYQSKGDWLTTIHIFHEGQELLLEDNQVRSLKEAWELLSRFKNLMVFS